MIAAIYARKSTDQTGVADDAKSVTRQVERGTAYIAAQGLDASRPGLRLRGRRHLGRRVREAARVSAADERARSRARRSRSWS